MVAAGSVLQVADARHPQFELRPDDAGRRAGGAVGGGGDSVGVSGAGAGLSTGPDRAADVGGGITAVACAAAGGGVVQLAVGGLPLGAGPWPEPVGAVVHWRLAADVAVDSRRLLWAATAADFRPAHGGVAAADARHRQHQADQIRTAKRTEGAHAVDQR